MVVSISSSCRCHFSLRNVLKLQLHRQHGLAYQEVIMRKYSAFSMIPKKNLGILTSKTQGFHTISARLSTDIPVKEAVEKVSFQDIGDQNLLHPKLVKTLVDDLKFAAMMPIQAATIQDLLANRVDCLAQARTGTGKTIAFLIPAIQTLVSKDRRAGRKISLLVISPTRELALQIAREAKQLITRFPQFSVGVTIGGTNKEKEQRDILKSCDILIATPGRLLDHLSEPRFVEKFQNLETLVLDEADRLLDMGFKKDLEKIISYLPDKNTTQRQGMLFSATIAPYVEKIANQILRDDYKYISTIPSGEKLTHEKVPQNLISVPAFADLAAALFSTVSAGIKSREVEDYKAIIFAPTAALTDFYFHIFQNIPNIPYSDVIHSRISQNRRNRTTNTFREARCGILFATDVVARGIDIPAITDVIQVGIPQDKDSYIHRLGRTARAGAEGNSHFIITEYERFFAMRTLCAMKFIESPPPDLSCKKRILHIAGKIEPEIHKKVYQSWLGYYKGHIKGFKWTMQDLVAQANQYAMEGLGVKAIPQLTKDVVAKLGMRGMPGLNVIPKKIRVPKVKEKKEIKSEDQESIFSELQR